MSSNSHPRIVSTITTELDPSQRGDGYKFKIDQESAVIFSKQVKNIREGGHQKTHIPTLTNTKLDVAINSIQSVLQNDVNVQSRSKELKESIDSLKQMKTDDMYYKFDIPVPCEVVINGSSVKGNIIGIDDGECTVVNANNQNYAITIDGNLMVAQDKSIGGGYRVVSSNTSSVRRANTRSSSSVRSNGSTVSSGRSSGSERPILSERSIFSTSIKSENRISSSSGKRSDRRNTSSVLASSGRTSSQVSESPFMATSEYLSGNSTEAPETQRTSGTETVDQTEIEEQGSDYTDTDSFGSTSTPIDTEQETQSSLRSSSGVSSSNRSDFYMTGGAKSSKSKEGNKPMRAGFLSLDSNEDKDGYFSESSSGAEEGLCE